MRKLSRRSIHEEKNQLQAVDHLCCNSSFGGSGSGIINKRWNERVCIIGKTTIVAAGLVVSDRMDDAVYVDGIGILLYLSETKPERQGCRGTGNLWDPAAF